VILQPAEKATAQGINDFLLFFIVSTFSLTSGSFWSVLQTWTNVNLFSMFFCLIGLAGVCIVVLRERYAKPVTEDKRPLVSEAKEQ
jgi:hypothetical protein